MITNLTPIEQAFWYQHKLNPKSDSNNIVHKIMFSRPLSKVDLDCCLENMCNKYPILKSRFIDIDGTPVRKAIGRGYDIEISTDPLLSIDKAQKQFDLENDNLLRCVLLNSKVLYVTVPHIIFDEISWNIFVKDLCKYIKGDNNKIFEITKDTNYIPSELNTDVRMYWKNELIGASDRVGLMSNNRIISDGDKDLSFFKHKIDKEMSRKLKQLAISLHSSMNSMLMTLFCVTLNKTTSDNDIVIGTPVTIRDEQSEDQIGCYINVLPCRFIIKNEDQINNFISKKSMDMWSHLDMRNFSLLELLRDLKLDQNDELRGLYNVIFEYVPQKLEQDKLIVSDDILPNLAVKLDLMVSLFESLNGTDIYVEYRNTQYSKEYIENIIKRFINVCDHTITNPDSKIKDISILFRGEDKTLIEIGRGDKRVIKAPYIWNGFQTNASANRDSIAVKSNYKTLTYSELEYLSLSYADKLKELGASEGSIIGVYMDRSVEYVATMLAIWSLGAIYVPLDINHPSERITSMITQANIGFIVTNSDNRKSVNTSVPFYNIDNPLTLELKKNRKITRKYEPTANDVAYIIFTSGSTGLPKGVMVKHQGFMNHLEIMIHELGLNKSSVVAQTAEVSFDISVWQLICPLLTGGAVRICSKDDVTSVQKIYNIINKDRISVLEIVPSLLSVYLEAEQSNLVDRKCLKNTIIITTGEAISPSIVKQWFNIYQNKPLLNAYGPAEASDDTHFYHIKTDSNIEQTIPIGHPLFNIETYILNNDMQLCPIGIIGEIHIGGIAVADGYINDKKLTDKVFIDNPFLNSKSKMYRTGDYGMWRNDGALNFLGRKDHQVKINGQRLELGEIENKILNLNYVKDVAVIFEDTPSGKRLRGYITFKDKVYSNDDIKRDLENKLPSFMIPRNIKIIDNIPRNSNGKLDRKYLESLRDTGTKDECLYRINNTTLNNIIKIWSDNIGGSIKPDANYFDAGGDSLLSVKIVNNLNKAGVTVSVRDILMYQTPEELAAIVEDRQLEQFNPNMELGGDTPIQLDYLEETGKYREYGEIQAALLRFRINEKDINFENIISRMLETHPSLNPKNLKNIFKRDDSLAILSMKQIENMVELMRTEININHRPATLRWTISDGIMYLLIVAHHFVIDYYSWKIIYDDISLLLNGITPEIHNDQMIKIWLGNRLNNLNTRNQSGDEIQNNSNTNLIYTNNKQLMLASDTKIIYHNFSIGCDIEPLLSENGVDINSFVCYSIAKAYIQITSDSMFEYNIEASVRQLDKSNVLSKEIGWMTYKYPRVIKPNDSIAEVYNGISDSINGGVDYGLMKYNANYDGSPRITNPSWTINYIGKTLNENDDLKIIKTKSYKDVPYIELDIITSGNHITFECMTNTNLSDRFFGDLWEKMDNIMHTILNDLRAPNIAINLSGNREKNILDRIKNG
ncbi:MAG: amino acid adenylation domain-containing protein [Candidatus Saccharibacteria bacterium]